MKALACIIITFFLFSCGKQSAIDKKLSDCDSLVITFNLPGSDSVLNIVSTTEKKAIRKLSGFMHGKNDSTMNCGFDGNMIFYSKGEITLPVIFKYSVDKCRYFKYKLDDQVMNCPMSDEGVAFFKSLAEGKPWY
jgi:hypothetical protein